MQPPQSPRPDVDLNDHAEATPKSHTVAPDGAGVVPGHVPGAEARVPAPLMSAFGRPRDRRRGRVVAGAVRKRAV